MSRNAMNACIEEANQRDEQRETALREWAESVRPLGIVERLRNGGQGDLADIAKEMTDAMRCALNVLTLLTPELENMGLSSKRVPLMLRAAIAKATGEPL